MNLSTLIEVAIGVLFVWILLAAITSAIQDWISQLFRWKATMLEEAIGNILVDNEATQEFYNHPLIKGLHSQGGKRKPSEIPNRQFVSVVFDLLMKAGTDKSIVKENASVYDNLKATVDKLKDKSLEDLSQNEIPGIFKRIATSISVRWGKTMTAIKIFLFGTKKINLSAQPRDLHSLSVVLDTLWIDIDKADQGIGQARERLEVWFDDAMKRLGGAYKRRAQLWSLIIGIALAWAINADSLAIANKLWTDPLVRAAVVAQAEKYQPPDESTKTPDQIIKENFGQLQSFNIPLGWTAENMPKNTNDWTLKAGGIFLSGIAAAQGAPFWFEIMRKLINFRSGGGSGSSGGSSSEAAKKEDEPKG